MLVQMVQKFTATLRHHWTNKLQPGYLDTELPPGVRVAGTKEEVRLESSTLHDLYGAVNIIKESVIEQLVGSEKKIQTESARSNGIIKVADDGIKNDQEKDEEHRKKDASVEREKKLKEDEKEHDVTRPGPAENDSREVINDRKEAQQTEKKPKQKEVSQPGQHHVPAGDGIWSRRQHSPAERSNSDDSHNKTASGKSEPELAAESAPTSAGDKRGMQARTHEAESCETSHPDPVKEQSMQFEDNVRENNTSSNDNGSVATSERKNEKYEIDDSLWAYILFTDPQSQWDKKLSPIKQGKQIVELTGLSTVINKFKELCDTRRLKRAVTRTMQRVPDQYTAEVFVSHLLELSQNKVLVRLVADAPHYYELVGKNSDITELEKVISTLVESKRISDTQHPTTLASHSLASSVTNSSAETNTVPSRAAAAAGNGFSRGLDQIPARMTQQAFQAELNFQTALAHLRVQIVTGDLLNWPCEILVDSCDSELRHEGGLAWLFAKAAGDKMIAACNEFKRVHGNLQQCSVMTTTAGNIQLPVRCLMHACGPSSRLFPSQDECSKLLESTFSNCLMCANDVVCARSIALPAISSGLCDIYSQMPDDLHTTHCYTLTVTCT